MENSIFLGFFFDFYKGNKITKQLNQNLILIIGGKESYDSFKVLNQNLRGAKIENTQVHFLKNDQVEKINDSLFNFSKKRDSYNEIILVILIERLSFETKQIIQNFNDNVFYIIEKKKINQKDLINTKSPYINLSMDELENIFELYLKNPREFRSYFDPSSKDIRNKINDIFVNNELDIDLYKKTFIITSLLKRSKYLKIKFDLYLTNLKYNLDEIEQFFENIKPQFSIFFENKKFYNDVKEKILPLLFKNNGDNNDIIKIWINGIGTGQGAISIALLIEDYIQKNKIKKDYCILSTDISKNLIKKVESNLTFSEKDLKNIPKNFHKHLVITDNNFSLNSEITKKISFSQNDILFEIGHLNLDLIICKNVISHWKKSLQNYCFKKFSVQLKLNGFLLIDEAIKFSEEHYENYTIIENTNIFYQSIKKGDINLLKNKNIISDPQHEKLVHDTNILVKQNSKGSQGSIHPDKDHVILLKENIELKESLRVTNQHLKIITQSFQNTLDEQIKSSLKLKSANKDLSDLKNHLFELLEEKNENLVKEKLLNEQIIDNFNELTILKSDVEHSKNILEEKNRELIKLNKKLELNNLQEEEDFKEIKRLYDGLKDVKKNLEKKVIQRTRELEEKNERLKEYDYTVAHDLINPIGMILSYVDLYEHLKGKGKEKGRIDDIINKVKKSVEKSLFIINGILANFTVDKVDLKKGSLEKILNWATEQLSIKIEEKKVKIIKDLKVIDFICNEVSLIQVFSNIMSNSIKYSKKNELPIIEINSFKKENEIHIHIKDNGIGMKEEKLPFIFNKRERIGAENSEVKGYGIGLYNVKKMVEENNGTIIVKSKKDEGSIFILIFPYKSS
jgi:chemotaxis methyl-accepting protein methylase/signal transduction histidine kinase